MAKTKHNLSFNTNMMKRIITSLILVPLTIIALFLGFPFVNMIVLVFGAMFAFEWANMVPNKNPSLYTVVYATAMSVAVLFSFPAVFLLTLIVSSLLVWFKAKDEPKRKLLTLGVTYVSVGIGSILWFAEITGFLVTVWLLLMVWSVDVGGYVVGSNLKGPKLAPKISPNKTWSGLIGGVLLAVIVSALFVWAIGANDYQVFYIVLAAVVAVLSQIGDLLESAIKRNIGIKDSSQLIPGHGGVFDRIDGLLFVAPILVLCIKLSSIIF